MSGGNEKKCFFSLINDVVFVCERILRYIRENQEFFGLSYFNSLLEVSLHFTFSVALKAKKQQNKETARR